MLEKILLMLRRSKYVKRLLIIIFYLATKLPTRKKTIVFESFLGRQISDNPKAIYLYIKKYYPDYRLYWSIDRGMTKKFANSEVNLLPRFGLKWIFVMARAEFWITNSRLPLWLPKPKGTTYVQTWHGTPLKKLALDMDEVYMPGTNTEKYKQNFVKEASKWDLLISPNKYSTEIFRRAFRFNKQIIESGYPRNDILVNDNNPDTIQNLKKKANLPLDKKIILYAPTWRDDQYYTRGKYKFNIELDLQKLKEKFQDNYIFLFRLHYLVAEQLDLSDYEGFIYDMSQYEDINELYLISDILITDYSSVFFDYAILKRPILFFVYDIEKYRDQLRGFYFDFERNAPGPLVKTTDELVDAIYDLEKNNNQLHKNFPAFYERFCALETGHATEKVVHEIIGEPGKHLS